MRKKEQQNHRVEELFNKLYSEKSYSMERHGEYEYKIASSISLDADEKLHKLRELYIKRLRLIKPYLDIKERQRGLNTIANLKAQQAK